MIWAAIIAVVCACLWAYVWIVLNWDNNYK